MPYRNVYEDKNGNKTSTTSRHPVNEPEKDPRKIAEIYRRQFPGKDKQADTAEKLRSHERRIETARTLNRGI